MNVKVQGFLRGLGYAVAMVVLSYIGNNIGLTGWLDPSAAALVTGIIGLIEHTYTAPATA
jgi:hypothetical protein